MATVYIIYSKTIDKFYIGSCLNIKERIEQHNSSFFKTCYTAKTDDWNIFLTIENLDQEQARDIEAHIKRMKSRTYINNLLKYPAIIEKLKLKYVGSSR